MSGPGALHTLADALTIAATEARGKSARVAIAPDDAQRWADAIHEAGDCWERERELCCRKVVPFTKRDAFDDLVRQVEGDVA